MVDQGQSGGGDGHVVQLSLFTDAFVVRGTIRTRERRVTDILNAVPGAFIVLSDAVMDEYGSRALAVRTEYAHVNLGAVLFAVADAPFDDVADLEAGPTADAAIVSTPPFRITGRVHLGSGSDARGAVPELAGRFLAVSDAAWSSDTEARATAPIVAVNHARAQMIAPHREVDPWEGLDRSGGQAGADRAPDAIGDVPAGVASTSFTPGGQDPWGAGTAGAGGGGADPWRDVPSGQGPQPERDAGQPGNPWGGPGGDPWGAGRPRGDDTTG